MQKKSIAPQLAEKDEILEHKSLSSSYKISNDKKKTTSYQLKEHNNIFGPFFQLRFALFYSLVLFAVYSSK